MRGAFSGSLALVLCLSTVAVAQNKGVKQAGAPKPTAAITWADITGTWEGKTMKGKSDSVITNVDVIYGADKTITFKFPNRKPVAAKLISMAGDSVIVETEKYESITRPGHKTSVRLVSHVANHKMTGTFRATFDDGKTLDGTSSSKHKLK
jgi:hypothetical protein